MAVLQLRTLSGVAKGLTRTTDALIMFDASPEEQVEVEKMKRVREDLRMIKLREAMFTAVRGVVDLWSTDAGVSDVGFCSQTNCGDPLHVDDGFLI